MEHDPTFVERFLTPWNGHDVDGAMSLMTDDCVWEITRGSEPHGTLFRGSTAVRAAIADAFRTVPDVHYEPVRCHYGNDHVVVELLVTGRQLDGTWLNYHACDILILKDGKIAAKRSYRKMVV